MTVNELPLLELFTRLREAGLPLGIQEYQSVLQALQAGFGITDQAAMKRLCQTLWVKSADDIHLFNYHFEQVMTSEAIFLNPQTAVTQSESRQISQITRYIVLGGAFIVGVGITLGVGLYVKNWIETVRGKQQQTVTPTPTATSTQTVAPTPISNQPDLIFGSLLVIVSLASGYVLVRRVDKLITQHRISDGTSLPQPTASVPTSAVSSELTQQIKDEVQVAQAVFQTTSGNDEVPFSRFIGTTEYFPVTQREMKQILRYLRRSVREGPRTELDIEATVNQIGRQGLLLEPILLPRRVNRAEMLLLIDQDGSMVPFHALSHRLAETALRGGRLGKADIYYFHNCPVEYLYHDPNHQKAELVSDIVTHRCSPQTAVLIFSDAGAARGGYSEERYELTKQLLAQLRQRVRYIAWLNPLPRLRWLGTTSGEIARLVPMFELSRRGLQDAIGVLRGRPTNFEGRRK